MVTVKAQFHNDEPIVIKFRFLDMEEVIRLYDPFQWPEPASAVTRSTSKQLGFGW